MAVASNPPTVLLTNDDGPPGRDSPYIYGFARHLTDRLGWNIKVVIPSSQKSWIGQPLLFFFTFHNAQKTHLTTGKAYHIKDIIQGRYFYPRRDRNGEGEISDVSRPLREGEWMEWILLDGTPATCANIALHNLYPGQIDLVVSGPNLGRNSSAAFALSSGTIGAALSACLSSDPFPELANDSVSTPSRLSSTRAIAVSYATVIYPTPAELFDPAHRLACRILNKLWHGWTSLDKEVDLYNVNIPVIWKLLGRNGPDDNEPPARREGEEHMDVVWTNLWRNAYGSLFRPYKQQPPPPPGGPDATAISPKGSRDKTLNLDEYKPTKEQVEALKRSDLTFRFAPNFRSIMNPQQNAVPVGSDAWALAQGWASVTPLCASFAEPESILSRIPVEQGVGGEEAHKKAAAALKFKL